MSISRFLPVSLAILPSVLLFYPGNDASTHAQNKLPEVPIVGRPLDFSGVMGSFRISYTAEPTEVQVEDPITVKVRITGKGPKEFHPKRRNLRLFKEEARAEFYIEPVAEDDRVSEGKNGESIWEFVYRLRPKTTKVTVIPEPRLIYYSPSSKRFHTAYPESDPINLTVSPRPEFKPGAAAKKVPRDTAGGHDVVIVLDLSRSMLAEQPSRLERSLRALKDLADHLDKRGGPRLALVVFAAQPQLVFPLTMDYDHFRATLGEIEAGDVPSAIYPHPDTQVPPKSGTRIGAALTLAVSAFAEKQRGPRTVLLLSDGDDPEASDGEWMQGVRAAKKAGVPVHTVGIGDPTRESVIFIKPDRNKTLWPDPVEESPLQIEGKDVKTKLEEPRLRDIAAHTGGVYLPAQTSIFPLGRLLPDILAKQNADAGPLPKRLVTEGIALAMVVDVSGSMGEKDFLWDDQKISRLEGAKKMFRLFIEGGKAPDGSILPGRPQDLVSFVKYASYPSTVCPLTLDHGVLFKHLKDLEIATVPEGAASNPGDALALALTGLRKAAVKRKVIVLFNDGDTNVGRPAVRPREAAQLAGNLDIPIYAIDANPEGNTDEESVKSRKMLQHVAEITKGRYFKASNPKALAEVYAEIARLEPLKKQNEDSAAHLEEVIRRIRAERPRDSQRRPPVPERAVKDR